MGTLVILAAGAGSRFGGNKASAAVGPGGQALFEYSLFDAAHTGFTQVVFVIRDRAQQRFIESRLPPLTTLDVRFAFQALSTANPLPPAAYHQRYKPWGTAHAVLCAREQIEQPFAVINADDFYGRETYQTIALFLHSGVSEKLGALVAYRLGHTLSDSGGVNRGVCRVSSLGKLLRVDEVIGLHRLADGAIVGTDHGRVRRYEEQTPVSMTFWAFPQQALTLFEQGFAEFLQQHTRDSEYRIPDLVDSALRRGQLSMQVLFSRQHWIGLTFRDDIVTVRTQLQALTERGEYPLHFGEQRADGCTVDRLSDGQANTGRTE